MNNTVNKNFAMKDINRKIVITVDSNKTLARIYDGGDLVACGLSKCNPEDTFDFQTGAELAMKRAFEGLEVKDGWKVVKRDPKVGDYVRILNSTYTFDKPGLIFKVDSINFDLVTVLHKNHPTARTVNEESSPDFRWNYWKSQVEVVEKVKTFKPVKTYRVINRPPRPGDYIRITKLNPVHPKHFDKVGDVLKISGEAGGGFVVKVHVSDHPKLVEYFGGIDKVPFADDDQTWHYCKLFEDYEFVEEVTE